MAVPASIDTDELIQSGLRLVRGHLGLEVAFVAQLIDDQAVFRYVDGEADAAFIEVGAANAAATVYCRQLIDGRLPEFLPDAAKDPLARDLRITRELPIGTHLGVPIVFSDGSVYGTFCCFGHTVHDELDERDLDAVRMVAAMVTEHIEAAEAVRRQREQRRTRLRTLTVGSDLELHLAFQPIVSLATGELVGVEALARFPQLVDEIPRVFEDAWHLGVGLDLELRAVAAALEELVRLPEHLYLTVNVGPDTITSLDFLELMRSTCSQRVVVEVTEHAAIADYPLLVAAVEELSAMGVRLAIDDVGTGYSGLDHILRLTPHTLKIDGALIEDVDTSPAKQAMITALLGFANRVETTVVAERIETAAEVDTLRRLGVAYGQGYHFGRPDDLVGALSSSSDRGGVTRSRRPARLDA